MKLGWDRWRTRSWELVWSSASYHHHGLQREREREKTFKEEDHGQKGCWWSMVGCKDYYKVEYHHRLPIFITWSGGWLMGSQTERTDPCGWVGSLDGGGYSSEQTSTSIDSRLCHPKQINFHPDRPSNTQNPLTIESSNYSHSTSAGSSIAHAIHD